jgi:hypothetical protein
MQKELLRKELIFGILIMLVGASITPSISGDNLKNNIKSNLNKQEDFINLTN